MAEGCVILHNSALAQWLRFDAPFRTIAATTVGEVLPALRTVESLIRKHGWYAAGFISYEASSAFDPALRTQPGQGIPLLWFGLYGNPEETLLPLPDYSAYTLGEPEASISRSNYSHAIDRVKRYIEAGDTYQVNYTLRLQSDFQGDPYHLFLAMVRAQSPGYAAWVDAGPYAICSASPELFFRIERELLICKPMKGTVHRGRTLAEDSALAEWLHNSEKNRAENLMIVDMIRNDLGRVAETGSVRVPRMFEVEKHPTLWQMTSTVSAVCRKSFVEIMSALFPCASITGAPKIRTTEIIAELEPAPRGIYTGCIGFVAPDGNAQFNVAIRTAFVDRIKGRAEYGSGGGIVWDSASMDEYTEALLKARVLTEQRPEFSLLETILWTSEESYFLLKRHLRRLADSAEYFGVPLDVDYVRQRLERHAEGFGRRSQRVRLLVASDGGVEIQAEAMMPTPPGQILRVALAAEPVDSADVFLYHKTTNRSVYEKAKASRPGFDDVLLWNENSELTEFTIANVVTEIDGDLWTPPVSCGLLEGTYRAQLLQEGKIRERTIKTSDLKRGSRVYLINSVRKWQEAVLE
jgi:para-aminobenzoate synthetase/4-amino-4-deoxychorismate lyase